MWKRGGGSESIFFFQSPALDSGLLKNSFYRGMSISVAAAQWPGAHLEPVSEKASVGEPEREATVSCMELPRAGKITGDKDAFFALLYLCPCFTCPRARDCTMTWVRLGHGGSSGPG